MANIGLILFGILALVTVASAVGMITATNAIHAAMFLVLNFICIALFYLGLSAPFLAMVQITVYAGAIMVLFIFVIMLLGAERVPLRDQLRWQPRLAIGLVVLLLLTSGFIFLSPQVNLGFREPPELGSAPPVEVIETDEGPREILFGSPAAVGLALYRSYMLPFQIVGLLLLVAMIGAVVLAKEDRPAEDPKEYQRRRYTDPEFLGTGLTDVTPAGDK
ncbi:MAG: NADH-quinone oxidoreductase subunit J [Chloroflexi bacterium]|nr:NADH-quinone oxidoreductase subunit J [Chloroflexota bacterium]